MIPALIAGAALIGSTIYGAKKQQEMTEETNRTNVDLSRENRDWQERMSNTEIQRRVADMEKAGINKLMATGSGGASTPSTAAPHIENPGEGLASTVASSARNIAELGSAIANIKLAEANTKKTEAQTDETIQDVKTKKEMQDFRRQAEKLNLLFSLGAKGATTVGAGATGAYFIKKALQKTPEAGVLAKSSAKGANATAREVAREGFEAFKKTPKKYILKGGSKILKYGKHGLKALGPLSIGGSILDLLQMPGDYPASQRKKYEGGD
ncbi:MAG: DNA pilot protein [Arizlama microvirus]|nr:MAG: DNA pilot protein [Arizlama microvirus]